MLRRKQDSESQSQSPSITGLYVDVENLLDHARPFLDSVIENWDLDLPSPKLMFLYVKADLQVIWEMWALGKFPGIDITVKGIQHLTKNPSKNSADIALSLDAATDFLSDRVNHIVVISDDSDFAALFGKISELHRNRQGLPNETPFRWIMTDRENTRSSIVSDFCPDKFIHVMKLKPDRASVSAEPNGTPFNATELVESVRGDLADDSPSNKEIAETIIEHLPVGNFKSSSCQPIIRQQWPRHSSAAQGSAAFGIWFSSEVLSELKAYGVLEPNPNRKPKQFVMTEAAKQKIGVNLFP